MTASPLTSSHSVSLGRGGPIAGAESLVDTEANALLCRPSPALSTAHTENISHEQWHMLSSTSLRLRTDLSRAARRKSMVMWESLGDGGIRSIDSKAGAIFPRWWPLDGVE